MKFAHHPIWLVGFRPFFILACLAGLSLPLLWVMIFSGEISLPNAKITGIFSPTQWHAHEMFFGFGWAVLGGFLLTSTKNWVKIRGYHGYALIFLVCAWLLERLGMWYADQIPTALFTLSNNLFLGAIVLMLLHSLIKHRQQDAFRDNYLFLIMLPMFLLSKNLLLSDTYFQVGTSMALGLFRLAFLIMLERTLTQFMRSNFKVEILRNPQLDTAIKLLALPLVFAGWLPNTVRAGISLLLAFLLLCRFIFWKPQLAFRKIELSVMYLGYLAIVAQLIIDGLNQSLQSAWLNTSAIHTFTLGAMGLIIPAMIIRISKGHTGRSVSFDRMDRWVLRIMIASFIFRVIAPQIDLPDFLDWLWLAASCWLISFSILLWRYAPYLLSARLDGKEH